MYYLLIIFTIIIIILAIFIYLVYRNLNSKQVKLEKSWRKIDNHLIQHADLVPSLIRIIEDYNIDEVLILDSLRQSHDLLLNARTVVEKNQANNQLNEVINKFFVKIDEYPNLKKDKDFNNIKKQLNQCNVEIDNNRNEYNQAVLEFNDACETFPNYYFTKILGFKERDYFKGSIVFDNYDSQF